MGVEEGDTQGRGPGAREGELERGSAVSNGGNRWFKVRSGTMVNGGCIKSRI